MISPAEFEAFRQQAMKVHRAAWLGLAALAIAIAVIVDLLIGTGTGSLVGASVAVAGMYPVQKWLRTRWIRRFPELRELEWKWRKDPEYADRLR